MDKNGFLRDTFAFIDEHITECITISRLGAYLHYSVYHFSRTFTGLTGLSPTRYITLRKLQYAIYDLSSGDKVIDVALKYGFETPEGFTKAFKGYYGHSPAKYPYYDKVDQPNEIDTVIFNKTFGGHIMTSQPVQKGALSSLLIVEEKGIRKQTKHRMPTHAMGFPAMMAAARAFMGMPPRIEPHHVETHNITFAWDLDYYFHVGVSTEGFGMFYDLPQAVIANNYWDGEPLRDCFAAEGIKYRLLAEDGCILKDGLLIDENIEATIQGHLKKDLPLIILYNANQYLFVTGMCENNMQLLAYPFTDGGNKNAAINMQRSSRLYQNWNDNIGAIILSDGTTQPVPRKKIILKALRHGYEMLTETKPTYHDYGYGDNLYTSWISYIDNDGNYKTQRDSERYISPEWCDMAERRAWTAEFFIEAKEYIGQGRLKAAREAFMKIHDNMWRINNMVSGGNAGKLLERETRDKIIAILGQCRELDHQAADNIKSVLE